MKNTAKIVALDDLPALIGTETGVSAWLTVTQDDVDHFAAVTRDPQFIHIDPERAKNTPFGGTIAHGFLTLSMLSYFAAYAEPSFDISVENSTMYVNYGFNNIRFINPVRVGKRIRARSTLLSVTEKKPGQFLICTQVKVEIEEEKNPALVAEWLNLAFV